MGPAGHPERPSRCRVANPMAVSLALTVCHVSEPPPPMGRVLNVGLAVPACHVSEPPAPMGRVPNPIAVRLAVPTCRTDSNSRAPVTLGSSCSPPLPCASAMKSKHFLKCATRSSPGRSATCTVRYDSLSP